MDRKQVILRLPPTTVEQMDERADLANLSRNAWAERALGWLLAQEPGRLTVDTVITLRTQL